MPNNNSVFTESAKNIWNKLSNILVKISSEQESDLKLDTIQLVSMDPDDPLMEGFAWFTYSYSCEVYQDAVTQFTSPTKTTQGDVTQSLTSEEPKDAIYWYAEWGDNDSEPNNFSGTPEFKAAKAISSTKTTSSQNTTLEQKLTTWENILKRAYSCSACTFWVSIPHIAYKHASTKLTSSAFIVVRGKIESQSHKYQVSKILRDYILEYLFSVYALHIRKQHDYYAELFTEYLGKQSGEVVLTNSVTEQIHALDKVIKASVPVLIEGETGTGKYTVSMHVAKLCPEYLNECEKGDVSEKFIISINCKSKASIDQFDSLMKDLIDQDKEPRILIIDNLEFLEISEQLKIVTFREKNILGKSLDSGEKTPFLIFTVGGNARSALTKKLLIPELYGRISAFTISLPSILYRLHEKPSLEERVTLMRSMIEEIVKKLKHLLPNDQKLIEIDDTTLKGMVQKPWTGNYVELRQEILRMQLLQDKT